MSESSKRVVCKKYGSDPIVQQAKKYIDDRRKGRITSLKTKFKKFDSSLIGGLENNTILCVAAMSGAGKSTFSKDIRDSFVKHNPNQNFKQYVFNFEMVSFQQISRSIVTDADIALRDLYSVDKPLSDSDFLKLEEHFDVLSKRDVQFIEVPNKPGVIANSIIHYWQTECQPTGATMVYEIDHALLVKGEQGASEKDRIDDLMYALVEVKKYISSQGGNSIGLVLSQMNREIKSVERRHNADMHRPDTGCLFGASSIEMCSDYIAFIHIPAKLNIVSYTDNNLPTRMRIDDKIIQIPYLELVKQRSGASDLTIPMWNRLDRFTFDEMESEIFVKLHKEFIESGCGGIPEIKN